MYQNTGDEEDLGVDRIQQLRREYQQARREGTVPPYEELDPRRRGHENEAPRNPRCDIARVAPVGIELMGPILCTSR
ncbi:hypothetical protein EYF80_017675 [Liparis tanakae]|uniref:Partitioning defective 3 B n=1 Tax=Liparis tanakae TaxID=230148 RepID=A0A4Z2I2D5_9TELE|nr:hypothetical protein EYF80_017675 [Liparis tanakae]